MTHSAKPKTPVRRVAMARSALTGLDRKGLRRWLTIFFLALAVPTGILIRQAYSELKWEAFHHYREQAGELAARIDSRLIQLIGQEEVRSFTDYAFLNVAGAPSANFLQRSPLSVFPVASAIPGLIGYFQVDSRGLFSTPLLPQADAEPRRYGIAGEALAQRQGLADRLRRILSQNRLVTASEVGAAGGKVVAPQPARDRDDQMSSDAALAFLDEELAEQSAMDQVGAAAPSAPVLAPEPEQMRAQSAFDRLNQPPVRQALKRKQERIVGTLGRVDELKLEQSFQSASAVAPQRRTAEKKAAMLEKRVRKERGALPEPRASVAQGVREAETPSHSAIRIRTFESEIDPFEFSLLDSGHFVLYRKVWRDGQRYIQGALIAQQPFLRGVVEPAFRDTALSQMSDLIVAYQGNVFSTFSGRVARSYQYRADELSGELLYQTRLSAPLNELELIASINRLPAGPGGPLIIWVAAILVLVLCGGFYLMYRLGAGQIDLARQQQDFVSAVSHELKTPLTSIRMYAEMLREGWASEEKKRSYYDYIHEESERLSRLITNVLQLARLTRNDLRVELKPISVAELMDGIRSKVSSQIERSGFRMNLDCPDLAGQTVVWVDPDYFTQILINLVDNAVKFSAKTQTGVVDIHCRLTHNGRLQFSVRDYGPGVPGDQMKKIFKLFYRSENELTRETVGTGIGLSLVHQLALAMGGRVEVVNREPGAEFRVSFPVAPPGNADLRSAPQPV